MSIKKQLADFYVKQGLTGKHRRKAMQFDMKAARRNTLVYWAHHGLLVKPVDLGSAFMFYRTPEGSTYWERRAYHWAN